MGLPAEAHGGTRSPQGAPTLLVASFHLHSLCSKAPAKPVLLSLRDAGRKQARMATSFGREHPGPEGSPSATLPCRKADGAATLCGLSLCPTSMQHPLLTKHLPTQHLGSWKFSG